MGNHHTKQHQSLHDVESNIDVCFVDLMTNVTKFSIDHRMILGWENSHNNLDTCKKLIFETHNLFKLGANIDTITSRHIPTIVTYVNAINLTHNSQSYRETSIKLLRMLTDLINTYLHMKSDNDNRLKRLEVENQQLRDQVANLNQQIIANAAVMPPQHVERPSAPPMDPLDKSGSRGIVIEL